MIVCASQAGWSITADLLSTHKHLKGLQEMAGQRKHIQLEAVVWAKNVSSMAEVKEEWPGSFELKGSLQPRCAEEVL